MGGHVDAELQAGGPDVKSEAEADTGKSGRERGCQSSKGGHVAIGIPGCPYISNRRGRQEEVCVVRTTTLGNLGRMQIWKRDTAVRH